MTFCEKFDGKVVERSCFCNAEFDGMEAVPLMLGMVMVGIGDKNTSVLVLDSLVWMANPLN